MYVGFIEVEGDALMDGCGVMKLACVLVQIRMKFGPSFHCPLISCMYCVATCKNSILWGPNIYSAS